MTTILSFRDPKKIAYVGKFIPDLANRTEPQRRLPKTESKFNWGQTATTGFEDLKLGENSEVIILRSKK